MHRLKKKKKKTLESNDASMGPQKENYELMQCSIKVGAIEKLTFGAAAAMTILLPVD